MSFKIREEWKDADPVVRGKHDGKLSQPVVCGEESKVQHQFQAACDINKMMNFENQFVPPNDSDFRDMSGVFDFAGNMQKAIDAQNAFTHLPIALRKRVGHSVDGLIEFMSDPKNREDCVQYGLFKKPEAELEPQKVHVVNYAPEAMANGDKKKTKVIKE